MGKRYTSRWLLAALLAGLLSPLGGTAQAQTVTPGPVRWIEAAVGFEVAEVPVLEDGTEVERIHLARIDPNHFRFEVYSAPAAARTLSDWMRVTDAALIVNGSYFDRAGNPATPVVSRGATLGPRHYGTKHGAFVVTPSGPQVMDLKRTRWQQAFRGASDAMVSFPMLIDAEGKSRAGSSNPEWVANRSFIAQDAHGRVVIGTTQSGYFSLDRFAIFLSDAHFDLKIALNLDGGPPACQGIAIGNYRRRVCSNAESAADSGGQLHLLGQLFGQRPWGLPIVLAVFPK
jgi:phosphodiester glycosidase